MPNATFTTTASKDLSVRRARDRDVMASMIQRVVKNVGAECEREDWPDQRTTWLRIKGAKGLSVTIDLDGSTSMPDVHLLSWHMASNSNDRLDNNTFGGDVNSFHQRKATYIGQGFTDMLAKLDKGLRLAQSGRAFLPREDFAVNEGESITQPERMRG